MQPGASESGVMQKQNAKLNFHKWFQHPEQEQALEWLDDMGIGFPAQATVTSARVPTEFPQEKAAS
jgi:hypothetical protein